MKSIDHMSVEGIAEYLAKHNLTMHMLNAICQLAHMEIVIDPGVEFRLRGQDNLQAAVGRWMHECFLPELYGNITERGDRFLEEVLELLQAHGYDRTRVPTLTEYVYSRPVGDPRQEVGGVMITLAGYCYIAGINMQAEGVRELQRIMQPEVMQRIREKQASKRDIHDPLPGATLPLFPDRNSDGISHQPACPRNCDCVGECKAGVE